MLLLLVLLLTLNPSSQSPTLTLPLKAHLLPISQGPSHLHHFSQSNQTYLLKSYKTLFCLSLKVQDYDYELSIDTGSADFFIKGEDMTGLPQRKYSCPECVDRNTQIQIGYLDGHLHTYRKRVNVTLGEHMFKEHILVAYKTNSTNYQAFGGIVGLSFQEIAKNDYPNFINTLINNKIVDTYVFGVKLNFRNQNQSFITFGGYDKSHIDSQSSMHYYPIPQNMNKYRISINGLSLPGVHLQIQTALFDTGNTCISIPIQHQQAILSAFNTNGNTCTFNPEPGNSRFDIMMCSVENFDALPEMVVKIGEESYPVAKEYYLDKCHDNGAGVWACGTLIEVVRNREELFLGDAFFLRYYAVFDLEKRRIGLAKNNDKTTLDDVKHRE